MWHGLAKKPKAPGLGFEPKLPEGNQISSFAAKALARYRFPPSRHTKPNLIKEILYFAK
jgi:hypothetical protein